MPRPDVVVLALGPAETTEVVTGAVAGGFEGRFLGSMLTFVPSMVATDVDPAVRTALRERFVQVAPWVPWAADTDAHRAMEAALGPERLPANSGFSAGWITSYPLKAVLEQAAEAGRLSRDGLAEAVEGAVVEYQGALPLRTLSEPATGAPVAILRTAPKAPLAQAPLADGYVGATDVGPYPCAAPEGS